MFWARVDGEGSQGALPGVSCEEQQCPLSCVSGGLKHQESKEDVGQARAWSGFSPEAENIEPAVSNNVIRVCTSVTPKAWPALALWMPRWGQVCGGPSHSRQQLKGHERPPGRRAVCSLSFTLSRQESSKSGLLEAPSGAHGACRAPAGAQPPPRRGGAVPIPAWEPSRGCCHPRQVVALPPKGREGDF